MELIELMGWMALGFIPTYAALEVGTRKLAKKVSSRLLINLDSETKRKTGMKSSGL